MERITMKFLRCVYFSGGDVDMFHGVADHHGNRCF